MTEATPSASPLPRDDPFRVGWQIIWTQRLLFLGVVALYLAAISHWWNTTSDSSLYLMLGENLAQGEGFTLYGQPHAFVPPGFPLIIAGLTRLGLGDMLSLNTAMTLMALATVFMIYHFLRSLLPEREPTNLRLALEDPAIAASPGVRLQLFCYDPAFFCTLVAAVLYDMYEVTTRQYSDIPFLLCSFIGLWAYCRGLQGKPRLLWLGTIALAATPWFRVVGLPLIAGAVVGLLIEPRKVSRRVAFLHAGLLTAATVATCIIFFLWYRHAVGGPVPQETYAGEITRHGADSRSILEWLATPFVNFWETGEPLGHVLTAQSNIPNWVGMLIFVLPMLLGMGVRWMRRQYLPLLTTIAYVGAILLLRPVKDRYLLPVVPMLLMYYADGIRWLIQRRPNRQLLAKFAVVAVLTVFAAIGVYKDIQRATLIHDAAFQQRYLQPLLDAAAALKANHREGEWFTTKFGENLSYVSGVPYRNLYGRFGWNGQTTPEEILRLLEEMNVTLVVDRPTTEPFLPYCETMVKAVKHSPKYRLVFDNKAYRIYRRLPLPSSPPRPSNSSPRSSGKG